MNLDILKNKFDPIDIEWRIGRSGEKDGKIWATALAYITARAIHDRLDEACGAGNWQLRYHEHLGQTICDIGIKIDNEWVWKSGGADQTQFEAFKGGLSNSEKRAGVPWGIGRYLYDLEETFITEISEKSQIGYKYQSASKDKNGTVKVKAFYWKEPKLPKWALPTEYTYSQLINLADKIDVPDNARFGELKELGYKYLSESTAKLYEQYLGIRYKSITNSERK